MCLCNRSVTLSGRVFQSATRNCIQKGLPENIHDFVSECIHCNVSITIIKRVVYTKDWFDAGIVFVRHLMDNKGNYLTFKTFK